MEGKRLKAAKKHNVISKAVSLLLCFCMLTGVWQSFVISANAVDEPEVSVYYNGKEIESLQFSQSEKAEVTAVCTPENGAYTYQWQVLADITSNLWVNIYDGTEDTLALSYALLSEVLDVSGSAYIRAIVKNGSSEGISKPVCVTVTMEEPDDNQGAVIYAMNGNAVEAASNISGSETIAVKINYLDAVTGLPIYTSFSAQISKGSEHIQSIASPIYLGYKPYYNSDNLAETDPDKCNTSADTVEINISSAYNSDTYTVNVYYKAVKVSYAVKYYFQNIGDDFYTEDSSLYKIGMAETGTIITDKELSVDREGFTKLYHYPQAVAGDGSTVFECYYDRNYSMLKFELDGGYGVEPVYARYGTPILINEPARPGYAFKGWQLMDDLGNYGDTFVETPDTVPAVSRTYKAVWEAADTSYSIAYWLQNADDDDYNYIGAETRVANSGDIIEAADTLRADTPICGQIGGRAAHAHTDTCYAKGFKHYIYDKSKTESENRTVTVNGDGSTIINIYYTRQYYTLRFIYAKEYNAAYDVLYPNKYQSGYSIVGGSTYGFGNKNSGRYWPNGVGNDYTLTELMQKLKAYTGGDKWGHIPNLPVLKNDQYVTGVYPAEGQGWEGGDYDYYGDRYHYFDLTARYGADLTALWPIDVFEQIEVPAHTANGAQNYRGDGEWGNYAYLAGWNGEYKVNYSLQKENSTVKGLYQKLDDGLLFGSVNAGTEGAKQMTYAGDTKTERQITAKATVGGEEVTSYLNYYLAFFNNGANFNWNIPREWNYEYYVPVLEGDLTAAQETQIKNSNEPLTLDNGVTYYYYKTNDVIYQLGAKIVTSDDNQTAEHQTQCSLVGYDFAGEIGSGITDSCARAEKIYNGILADKRESYTLRLFYARQTYAFGMYNYNSYYRKELSVPFKTLLDKFVLNEEHVPVVPDYPGGLENGAYTFDGWYTSPGYFKGTEYVPGSKMPDSNKDIYAKWLPNTYTVNLFGSYDEMLAFEQGDTTVEPIETRIIKHGEIFGSVADPVNGDYDFSGWFYMKNGQKTAYTPLDVPVKSDLNVYAEWNSSSAQPYIIYYALDNKETVAEWLTALKKAAGAAPQDNHLYTVTVGTVTRSYVYLAADSGYHLQIADPSAGYAYQGNMRTFLPKTGNPFNRLYDGYNIGYYPTLSGHSIAIAYEEDKDNPVHNIFTFTYVYLESVDYRVEYRYKDSNELITVNGVGDNGSGIAEKSTSMGVVTERFVPVADHIADAFYKKLIISVEKDENGNYTGSKDNVITFYYTQNSENTYYAVHYMLEDIEGGSYTESSVLTEGIAKIGNEISIVPAAYSGFTVETTARLKVGETFDDLEMTDGGFTFTVTQSGSELYVYYTRNIQNYAVYYLLDGTDISDLSNLPEGSVLADTDQGSGKYRTTVTAAAKAIDNYNCTTEGIKSIELHSNNKQNYIVFFYTPLSYTVQYRTWQLGGGTFDVTNETATGNFSGSIPKADNGYAFEGWYLDEECTVPVGDLHTVDENTNKLTPNLANLNPQPKTNIFYAKFMPAFGEIRIERNNTDDESGGSQTFVYKITSVSDSSFTLFATVTGNSSVTVKNLPIGDYIVEQQNSWSWRYEDSQQTVSVVENSSVLVTYNDASTQNNWLNGNSAPIRNRKNKE